MQRDNDQRLADLASDPGESGLFLEDLTLDTETVEGAQHDEVIGSSGARTP